MTLLRLYLVSVFVLSSLVGSTQDFSTDETGNLRSLPYESFGFLGAGVGVSVPLGQFASSDFRNLYSGYATQSYYLNFLNFHHRFSKHFGVGLLWNRNAFDFNASSYNEPFSSFNPALQVNTTVKNPWVVHSGTVNFVTSIQHKIADFDLRIAGGLGRPIRPQISLIGTETSTGYLAFSWIQEMSAVNTFIWGFGFNVRLHVYRSLDLFVAADYQRMDATFDVVNVINISSRNSTEVEQSFEMLTYGVGLGLTLR